MKTIASILGLVLVLAVGLVVYKSQFTNNPAGVASPQAVADVVGVKTDLVVLGQAERLYLSLHGSYASLEQLQQDGAIGTSGANHRGYSYSAEIDDGVHFKITASPANPANQGWPRLAIDETMEVTQQ